MKRRFVIIGEQKAGTGWLRDRLREHPDVFCHPREVNYFNLKRNYSRGSRWYERQIGMGSDRLAVGEKSPDYFWLNRPSRDYFANPLELIARDLPDARIILSLRNPVDRAISAFNHHLYHRGRRINPHLTRREPLDSILFGEHRTMIRTLGIIERGFYAERLRLARELFGSRLLVLIFEEAIAGDPALGMRRVCEHLGIDGGAEKNLRLGENRKEHKPAYAEIVIGYHVPVLRPVLRQLPLGPPYRVPATIEARQRLADLYLDDTRATLAMLARAPIGWPAACDGGEPRP